MDYILRSMCILALFYVMWFFVLRKYIAPQVQRFFLLLIIVLSLILPVVPNPFSGILDSNSPFILNLSRFSGAELALPESQNYIIEQAAPHVYWVPIFWLLYLCGMLLFTVMFLQRLYAIFRLINRQKVIKKDNLRVVYQSSTAPPLSFFRYIFLPSHFSRSRYRDVILEHEIIHSSHLHSLDVIVGELLIIFQWFNPFAWLLRTAIKQNHEYVTDREILKRGFDKVYYQKALLNQTLHFSGMTVVSPFNQPLIKKRINAMSNYDSFNYQNNRLLFIIPLIFAITCLLGSMPHAQPNKKSVDMLLCPLNAGRVTAEFGEMMHPFKPKTVLHKGIDIAAPKGTDVHAAADGTILISGCNESSGNYIIIVHKNNYSTFYSHLEKSLVVKDQKVSRGDIIARVGSTGLSTAPHLHFELRLLEESLNPEEMMDFSTLKP